MSLLKADHPKPTAHSSDAEAHLDREPDERAQHPPVVDGADDGHEHRTAEDPGGGRVDAAEQDRDRQRRHHHRRPAEVGRGAIVALVTNWRIEKADAPSNADRNRRDDRRDRKREHEREGSRYPVRQRVRSPSGSCERPPLPVIKPSTAVQCNRRVTHFGHVLTLPLPASSLPLSGAGSRPKLRTWLR